MPEERKFARGARPSPRHKLLSAAPHVPVKAPPPNFAGLATQLSYWLNDQEGDCVTAEEAHAKGAWSAGYCGMPDLFIPDDVVGAWARKNGFANGADLSEVMDAMASSGFVVNGVEYKDGPHQGVDYTNLTVLQSAITQGPVKIAIDANALPSGAGNQNGWYAFGAGRFPNTDHCVGLAGYGTAAYCFGLLRTPIPAGVDPNKADCFILFTWHTYGVVDLAWLGGTCTEAWVRNPTTPGQSPTPPVPPVPPVPVPPTPVPPAPPVPTPPIPGPGVSITLTADQVSSVIEQSGVVTISGDMPLSDYLAALDKAKTVKGFKVPEPKPRGGLMKFFLTGLLVAISGAAVGSAATMYVSKQPAPKQDAVPVVAPVETVKADCGCTSPADCKCGDKCSCTACQSFYWAPDVGEDSQGGWDCCTKKHVVGYLWPSGKYQRRIVSKNGEYEKWEPDSPPIAPPAGFVPRRAVTGVACRSGS